MFEGAGDNVNTAFHRLHGAGQRQVVRFGPAAGEDNLLRPRAHQRRRLPPRLIHGLARFSSGPVQARRVPEGAAQVRLHGLCHARIQGRRGGVVEIDQPHCHHSPR